MRGYFAKAIRLLLFGALMATLGGVDLQAQRPAERGRGVPEVREIDQQTGDEVMEIFRNQRLHGDYVFRFDLVYLPRRGEAKTFEGMMWGTWMDGGPRTRVAIWDEHNPGEVQLQLLVQGGNQPVVWRSVQGQPPVKLDAADWEQPILPPMSYAPFDLLMPFIFWEDYRYEGSERLRGRPAHRFRIYAAERAEAGEVDSVELSLDARFNALLRAEMLDRNGELMRSLRVQSYRLVDEQYIVKTLDLMDEQSRDRTRFQIWRAAVGLELPKAVFDPATLADIPYVEGLRLESI